VCNIKDNKYKKLQQQLRGVVLNYGKQIAKLITSKTNFIFTSYTTLWQIYIKFILCVLNSDFPLTRHTTEKILKALAFWSLLSRL